MNSQCIRPIIHIFDSFFIVSLVKSLNKHSGGQWNEKPLLLVYHHLNGHILYCVLYFYDKNKDYLIIFFLSAWRWRMRGAPPSGKGLRQGSANIPASWLGRKRPYWLSCSAGWSSSSMGPVVTWQIIKQTSGSSHMKVRHFYESLWISFCQCFIFGASALREREKVVTLMNLSSLATPAVINLVAITGTSYPTLLLSWSRCISIWKFGIYFQVSNTRCTKSCSCLCAIYWNLVIEGWCQMKHEDVVGAAPIGDAPTTSDWSTILLPTKGRLILVIWQ